MPSPTTNLLSENDDLDLFLDEFYEEMATKLDAECLDVENYSEIFEVDGFDGENRIIIQENIEKLQSWEWIYGKTPKFTYKKEEVVKGVVKSSKLKFGQG